MNKYLFFHYYMIFMYVIDTSIVIFIIIKLLLFNIFIYYNFSELETNHYILINPILGRNLCYQNVFSNLYHLWKIYTLNYYFL
jgi:hypothetical protein